MYKACVATNARIEIISQSAQSKPCILSLFFFHNPAWLTFTTEYMPTRLIALPLFFYRCRSWESDKERKSIGILIPMLLQSGFVSNWWQKRRWFHCLEIVKRLTVHFWFWILNSRLIMAYPIVLHLHRIKISVIWKYVDREYLSYTLILSTNIE